MIQVTWGEGRRMTGEVIWSKPRASGKGTSSSGKVKFLATHGEDL